MSSTNETKGRLILNAIVSRTVFLVITASLMFVSAGTLKWMNAWLYLSLFYSVMLLVVFVHLMSNPENVKLHQNTNNTNKLDKILVTAYNLMLFVFPATAGFLFRINTGLLMNHWLLSIGLVVMAVATFFALWSIRVNQYFEVEIKVQGTDHQVIDSGPYRIVRHPGYLSSIMMWCATPLILQNKYLFIFSILFSLFFIVRTHMEDKQLKKELAGYKSYTDTVKFRLIPCIW